MDEEQLYVPVGMLLAWLVERGLTSSKFRLRTGDAVPALQRRRLTGPQLYRRLDGVLSGRMLSADGKDFVAGYLHHDEGGPSKGMVTIFNRSHYEDVLVVRVHGLVPESVWQPRYQSINHFEQTLTQEGLTVLKFYLHISKDEQERRLKARLANPTKRWKFNPKDLQERELWDDYLRAYEDAINQCSTPYAPWYVVPANKKWFRNLVVARTIADTLDAIDPCYPEPDPQLPHDQLPT